MALSLTLTAVAPQIVIPRIEEMPNIPQPFVMKDWRATARGYDALVFNPRASGEHLPLLWWDESRVNTRRTGFGLPAYAGQRNVRRDNDHEAINCLAAVLGATLVGIDKHHGEHDWVLMCRNYWNTCHGEDLVINNINGHAGNSFWYDLFPQILYHALADCYPEVPGLQPALCAAADRWYAACLAMGGEDGQVNFNHTGYSFARQAPVDNGRWREPDSAAGIGWILYTAYVRTGDPRYLRGAEWAIGYLSARRRNPLYEILLPFGALTAARMNAEAGYAFDVQKLLGWCFSAGSDARPGWGMIVGRWGEYDAHGLMGSTTDSDGYAFAMNTFESAAALLPLVRYDQRYARAIGKWMLNVANNARLFYADTLPAALQDSSAWRGDQEHVICYEGVRHVWSHRSPFATGDAIRCSGGATNFALYGASHVGVFAGLLQRTDDEKILQLDCLKTDYGHPPAYPTYLLFNPYLVEKTVTVQVGAAPVDLYDAVTHQFIREAVSGGAPVYLPPNSAVLLVMLPAGGEITTQQGCRRVDGVVIDYQVPE